MHTHGSSRPQKTINVKERSLNRINTNLFFQIKPTEVATNSSANLYEEIKKANFLIV